jgi:hypothetical protein
MFRQWGVAGLICMFVPVEIFVLNCLTRKLSIRMDTCKVQTLGRVMVISEVCLLIELS